MSVVIHFDAKIENKLSLKTYFQNIFDDGKKKTKRKNNQSVNKISREMKTSDLQ